MFNNELIQELQAAGSRGAPNARMHACSPNPPVPHCLPVQRIVQWARKRWESGLAGFGYPWQVSWLACLLHARAAWQLCLRLHRLQLSTDSRPIRSHMGVFGCCVVQEGEDAWLLAGHLQSRAEQGWAGGSGDEEAGAAAEADVPAEELADADSRWVDCGGLRVHYKLALPLVSALARCMLLTGTGTA